MSSEREAFPLIFYVDKADTGAYGNRDLWPSSGPNKPTNGEKFIIAMAYGFKMNLRTEIKDRDPAGYVRTEFFKDDDQALMYAVAVASQGSLDVVLDGKEVAHIAEEYARGGIALLAQRIADSPGGTLWDDLEVEVLEETPAAQGTEDSLSPDTGADS